MRLSDYDRDVPKITSAREFIQHALRDRPGLQKLMLEQLDRVEAGLPTRKIPQELDVQLESVRRHFEDAA